MTTNQKNYLDMFVAVKETYEQHKTIFDAMPARLQAFTNFLAKVAAIQSAGSAQTSNTTGITQDKEVLRVNLCNLSYTNMQVIKSYAIASGNNTLKTEMDYELSDLLNTTDETIAGFCQLRLDKANTLLVPLADYDITAATITTWQDAIDDYNEASGNPRNASNNQSTITDSIKVLIKETNDMLNNQIDALVQPLKATQNAVYVQYFKSRKIINRGNPPQEPENPNIITVSGITIDDETGDPVGDVTIKIGNAITIVSNPDGTFSEEIEITEPTTFTVTISKPGYLTRIDEEEFLPGEDRNENVPVEPTGYLFGVATNSATTSPLGGVIITDIASGISTVSNPDGSFVLEGIPEGNRDISYAYAGFQTTVINRNFVKRIPVEQNVSLQPNP